MFKSTNTPFNEYSERSGRDLTEPWDVEKSRDESKFPVNHNPKAKSALNHPRLNKIAELRTNLNHIKNYEAKILATEKDFSSQPNLSRAFTSKLNFPPHRAIFTDLPTLDDPIVSPSADHLIQRAASKTKEKNKKSQEVRDEVGDLVNKLVALEYQNEDKNRKLRSCSLPNESDLLGFSKFKETNFHTVTSKKENDNFERKIHEELHHSLFSHEDYLTCDKQFDPDRKPAIKGCNCLNAKNFFNGHSKCS